MPRLWTHGIWTANAAREDEFVAAWREFIPISAAFGATEPTLLRDRERPAVFRSFGAWPDLASIERFRAEIFPRIDEMHDLLAAFEAFTLDEVYRGD